MHCPSCSFENPPGLNFCGRCGTPLTVQPADTKPKIESERRQITVMFCDIAGFTSLSGQIDPEELRDVVTAYQRGCAEIIYSFEGYIAQYLGDGLLVYFGYPFAHEDDAQRAVRTGLRIAGAIGNLSLPKEHLQQSVQIRIGIHTGLVVVGELGAKEKRELLALGETPNIAFRLQEIAQPNTVVISSDTYRLVHGYFECLDQGLCTLKGISRPVQTYRVTGERRGVSRFAAAVGTKLTPLVGREKEVGLLLNLGEKVKKGNGQVVLINGEPGIGKSRLLRVLRDHVSGDAHVWLKCSCLPYHKNTAFYPVIDLLERIFEFRIEDSPEEKFRKLERALNAGPWCPIPLQETVSHFASFLSLPIPDSYPPITLTPQKQKEKLLEALISWLMEVAKNQPVLFVMEDLHWADPSTLEFLNLLIDREPKAPIFIVLTFRPEFISPWESGPHITNLTVGRLSQKEVEAMVKNVAGEKTLPSEVLNQIVAKTDGVPLFVEELTKMVIESDLAFVGATGRSPAFAIPSTLQDSLMARLDRLAIEKEVVELGSTIGREYSYELLHAVSSLDGMTLQRELSRLVEAELLYQSKFFAQTRYTFKHALIQVVAYQSLVKGKRQQYHKRIAEVLEERFPWTVETQPELLAHHFTEAGVVEKAVPYWQRAGERAIERSANIEAIAHLRKGLELLKNLPETPERAQQELALRMTLGIPLTMTKGYAASEVEETYARALELCQDLGEIPELFPVLHGLLRFYLVRAEFKRSHELGELIMRIAQSLQDNALLVEANFGLGTTLFWLGDLISARACLEEGIALYDPEKHSSHAYLYGQDPGVACRGFASWSIWLLGYPDSALRLCKDMLVLDREVSHLFSLAYALHFDAVMNQFCCEPELILERAEEEVALSKEQGFTFWLVGGSILQGWALTKQDKMEEGIEQIQNSIAAWQATGAELARPYFLSLLAEAYYREGWVKEGLEVLSDALTMIDKSEERWWEAELLRLKGELLLAYSQGNRDEVEECFRRAIRIARRQSAKSLELRSVVSLSRLLREQERRDEAREILSEIYGWFTEGFDTRDLIEAKELLNELS
ncbi:MAG TPA: adenylate/guanylate cyclase domain-containing protein [Thermodesulfobacteriota bacterium]|nr:adenylate/guanylate cyclase domain-containing protein [Thermodesulfobacteriota bacterium]